MARVPFVISGASVAHSGRRAGNVYSIVSANRHGANELRELDRRFEAQEGGAPDNTTVEEILIDEDLKEVAVALWTLGAVKPEDSRTNVFLRWLQKRIQRKYSNVLIHDAMLSETYPGDRAKSHYERLCDASVKITSLTVRLFSTELFHFLTDTEPAEFANILEISQDLPTTARYGRPGNWNNNFQQKSISYSIKAYPAKSNPPRCPPLEKIKF